MAESVTDVGRVAVISDIHGNDVAFAAALADSEAVGVDEIVCLGDVAQGGSEPAETIDRLQALGCPVVLGNADAFLLDVPLDSPEPVTERQLEVREWTLKQLGSERLEFIRSFADTISRVYGATRLLAFHGSPRSYDDVLLPGRPGSALGPYRGHDVDLLAGGHTHKQWARAIDGALYFNPGSAGLAYDHFRDGELSVRPVAQYALVLVDDSGAGVEFREVPYAADEVDRRTAENGHPGAAGRWAPAPRC
jgi:predicted phosphodiesterase